MNAVSPDTLKAPTRLRIPYAVDGDTRESSLELVHAIRLVDVAADGTEVSAAEPVLMFAGLRLTVAAASDLGHALTVLTEWVRAAQASRQADADATSTGGTR